MFTNCCSRRINNIKMTRCCCLSHPQGIFAYNVRGACYDNAALFSVIKERCRHDGSFVQSLRIFEDVLAVSSEGTTLLAVSGVIQLFYQECWLWLFPGVTGAAARVSLRNDPVTGGGIKWHCRDICGHPIFCRRPHALQRFVRASVDQRAGWSQPWCWVFPGLIKYLTVVRVRRLARTTSLLTSGLPNQEVV